MTALLTLISLPLSRNDSTTGMMPMGSMMAKSTMNALRNSTRLKAEKSSMIFLYFIYKVNKYNSLFTQMYVYFSKEKETIATKANI